MLMTLVTKVVNVSRVLYGAALAGASAAVATGRDGTGGTVRGSGMGLRGELDEPPPNPAQPSHLGPSGRSPQPELPVLRGCAGADYPRCSASGSAAPSATAALLCSLPSPGRCTGASLPAGERGEAGLAWPLSRPSGDTVDVPLPQLGDAAGVWQCRRKAWLDGGDGARAVGW